MPQYCSKVPSKRDKFESSTTDWSQAQNKMLSSGRMKQKRSKKRKLDDGCYEVSPSAKKFISEEKMASYLQGLHIASDTHYQQQQHIGASEGSHPTHQELLHQRLQGDNGTDEAFYSPAAVNEPLLLHRSPDSSPEIRLNPPTPGNGNSSSNTRETKLHSLSRWDVIIEDLSSEEDDVATEEPCVQPTVYLSPEARENLGKTHLLPPSIIDELCSKPCMELIPWVPKEKIVQDSLLRTVQMESSSGHSLQHIPLHNTSINQEQIKEQLWDYSDNDMEL